MAAASSGCVAVALLLAHEPAFYRRRMAASAGGQGGNEPQASRRLVTRLSALWADGSRPGPWETVVTEEEVNAWLATALPRNHQQLLPAGMTAPRVAIGPRRLRLAARVGGGPFTTVASLDAEITLRGVNQVGVVVSGARLGALPLPRGLASQAIARRLAAEGLTTESRRLDGRAVLVVYTAAGHDAGGRARRLESLALQDGAVAAAGVTLPTVDRHD